MYKGPRNRICDEREIHDFDKLSTLKQKFPLYYRIKEEARILFHENIPTADGKMEGQKRTNSITTAPVESMKHQGTLFT